MSHPRNFLQRCNRFALVFNRSRKFSTTRSRFAYDSEGVMNVEEKRLALALRMRERDAMFDKYLWVPKGAVYGLVAYAALMSFMVFVIKKAEEAVNANEGASLSEKEKLEN
ncbi:hypothetical protein DdX_16472 [Ditylenchus destructor]|uniref:Uncharacterized protein n=1 Tax=Ditylenchus destructor TaxID=166010 RepID=A0AAD4MT41_9BILA|nr:hypothetical protein DdX_16472 [Ditylenchus destructor]